MAEEAKPKRKRKILIKIIFILLFLALFITSRNSLKKGAIGDSIKALSGDNVVEESAKLSYFGPNIQLSGMRKITIPKDGSPIQIKSGDRIVTGKDGRAALTFFEGSTTRIDNNSEVKLNIIEKLKKKADVSTISIKVSVGRTWNRIKRILSRESKFETRTPTAISAVRGTIYSTKTDKNGATTFYVFEGTVQVSSKKNSVNVNKGYKVTVESFGAISKEVLLEKSDFDEWYKWNKDLDDGKKPESSGIINQGPIQTIYKRFKVYAPQ